MSERRPVLRGHRSQFICDVYNFPMKWRDYHSVNDDGCWIYQGYIDKEGYGRRWHPGRGNTTAHKSYYLHYVGDYDEYLKIDHLCRNRSCVNPCHLEPVTHSENVKRGWAHRERRPKKYCKHGHGMDDAYVSSITGRRWCRTCKIFAKRELRARKSGIGPVGPDESVPRPAVPPIE